MTQYYNPQNYPKTSCICGDCPKDSGNYFNRTPIPKDQFVPSSLAINNCNPDPMFNCKNIEIISHGEQPQYIPNPNTLPATVINEDFGLDFQSGFFKCPKGECYKDQPTYASYDPRLLDPTRNQYLHLDRPPYTGDTLLKNVYNKDLDNVGSRTYKTYKDINFGQYQYYIDENLQKPYFEPLFTLRSEVQGQVFKDPMDSFRPQYAKTPITNDHRYASDYQETRDVLSHREDIMSTQMDKRFRTDWETAWKKELHTN